MEYGGTTRPTYVYLYISPLWGQEEVELDEVRGLVEDVLGGREIC